MCEALTCEHVHDRHRCSQQARSATVESHPHGTIAPHFTSTCELGPTAATYSSHSVYTAPQGASTKSSRWHNNRPYCPRPWTDCSYPSHCVCHMSATDKSYEHQQVANHLVMAFTDTSMQCDSAARSAVLQLTYTAARQPPASHIPWRTASRGIALQQQRLSTWASRRDRGAGTEQEGNLRPVHAEKGKLVQHQRTPDRPNRTPHHGKK